MHSKKRTISILAENKPKTKVNFVVHFEEIMAVNRLRRVNASDTLGEGG